MSANIEYRSRILLVVDISLVLVILFYDFLVQGLPASGTSSAGLIISCILCMTYFLHRRLPIWTYALALTCGFFQLAIGIGPLVANIMIFLSLSSLTFRCSPRISLPATIFTLIWVGMLGAIYLGESGFDFDDLVIAALLVIASWSIGQLRRTREQHLISLQERAEQLEKQRESDLQMAIANERTRIARELHDVVSHSLSAVKLLADGAVASVENDPTSAREAMIRVRDTNREAMIQMRSMLSVLRTEDENKLHPAPSLADIHALLEEAKLAGTPIHAKISSVEAPADVQMIAYRIVQEALTNVRKHAQTARRVDVSITQTDDNLRIQITDDGHDLAQPTNGYGLLGMAERVETLNGTLSTSALPYGGFEVLALLPLRKELQ